jgi:hypothetical protein
MSLTDNPRSSFPVLGDGPQPLFKAADKAPHLEEKQLARIRHSLTE